MLDVPHPPFPLSVKQDTANMSLKRKDLNNFPVNILCSLYYTYRKIKLICFLWVTGHSMAFFVPQYVPTMMRVRYLQQVLSHLCSCCIVEVCDILSNTFLKSVRQGTWSHRGVQLDGCSSTPASSWEVKHWLWSGSWSATGAQHHATPRGAKIRQNLGSWSAPGHVMIVLEANCLDCGVKHERNGLPTCLFSIVQTHAGSHSSGAFLSCSRLYA